MPALSPATAHAQDRAPTEYPHAIDFLGVSVDVASLEDVVLSKLEWAKLGDSARQLEDVAMLVRLWRDELDVEYIERWVSAMKLEPHWKAARALALDER